MGWISTSGGQSRLPPGGFGVIRDGKLGVRCKRGRREERTETLAFGERLRVPLQIQDGELFLVFIPGNVDALARLDGC